MRTVLGIDAAWTETQPSGVALVEELEGGWRLRAVAASYARFEARAKQTLAEAGNPMGSKPNAAALIAACGTLTGRAPDVVAVDMPLSHERITERRVSDNCVSRAYGARQAGTHTPNKDRPGDISHDMRTEFEARGYHLWTKPEGIARAEPAPGLIEVYPHPALIELTGERLRLCYKASKISKYWREACPTARKESLFAVWRQIIAALDAQIEGVSAALPPVGPNASGAALKAYEDMLDAVVCAWVGIRVLEGHAVAYGDAISAVWVPAPLLPASAP